MKRCLIALAIVALLPLTLTAADKSTKTSRARKPSPSLEKVEDVAGLPRVMLIGDSISMGYTVAVRELLKGVANVHRPPTNCGDTTKGLQSLDEWLGTGKWDVIHFNWGLHDLKYLDENKKLTTPDKGKQVNPLPVYEKNLRELVARLKKTGAKLIWCSTTPVPEGCDGRVKGTELEYNKVAAKIMKENGVAIDDLHAFATKRLSEIQLPKNVHFHADGSKKLAEQVVASIKSQLGK
ncbi:MAG: SGNH/GDSL hydrolase family protein [Verrucomicrobia bacterium]|nr:SGNH/GDSL hydrolase family protein [Verrucomicrobiota bacterium]